MNFFVLIFFIWMGFYGQIINYLKQALFQGKDITSNPQLYFKNSGFLVSVLALAVFAQGVWVVEVLIRQKLKLSSVTAYTVLISAPIAAFMQVVVLWLSEKYLADSINWWGAGFLAIGTVLSMIGGGVSSKMRVLLLNPPSPENYIRTGRWTRKSRANQSWPPIFLAYSAGLLEREGHECKLLDAGSERMEDLQTWAITEKYKPDLIAYYYGYDTLDQDLGFADILAKKFRTVLVGPWGHCVPDILDYVENINIVTVGEFDHTLLDIANGYSNEDILGIKYHNKYEIIVNDDRPLCSSQELDKLPFVTEVYKKHLNMKTYRQTSIRYPFVDLISARSCPHSCTFCLWIRAFQRMEVKRYRPRSIGNVIEEFWFIKNEMPEIKQIWLQDDTLPNNRARKLSQAIIDERLNICWGGYSRAEQDFETLSKMKDSGLRTLHVGYETSDPRTLELIQKNITVDQMEEFADHVHKLNLWTCAGFMIFPWQSKETIRNTIQWAKHTIRPRRFSFTQLFPYPNTPICDTIKDFKEKGHPLLTTSEMTELEKEGFKEIYIKNLPWMLDTLKFPREWKNVYGDAKSLLKFLFKGDS